ncbi:hypothetical protein SAMN05443549_102109 [Flavobacterium fluvii]|uniref:Beta-lactamase-inhibitor-like, PepSY-like n=1 Tax=Flavobacterium fluvii TaxID=468056 RepID=A0A1M5H7G9_9FLAO|nr:hypothetical protein [Flavobacterium fluvii]SHG11884.1 hypothetical protein SAMN05443549_102109 [Flavobacterium fluvii]
MKTIITFALCFSLFSVSYSQDKKQEASKIEKLPEIVISPVKKDLSKYAPDNNPDAVVRNIQNEFLSYKVDDECKNFDEYLVTLENEKGSLVATYNEKGVLMYISEKYVNVELPREVINSVYLSYPEWIITKSKFEYSQEKGQILKKAYHLKLKKDNKTQNILVSSTGKIIKTTKALAMN